MKRITIFSFLLFGIYNMATCQEIFNTINYPFPTQEFTLSSGLKIAYVDEGEGEVLLMIHGLGSYLPAWKRNIESLSKNHRCIAVDLIGYGKSSKTSADWMLKDHSAALEELMKSLGIFTYSLVGHSMGGQIAIHHALDYSENLKSLILVAPAGIETFNAQQGNMFKMISPEVIQNTSDEEIDANLRVNFYRFPTEAKFMIDDRVAIKNDPEFSLYAHMVANGIKGMVDQPVFENLADLNLPVLIVFGENDTLIPNLFMNPNLNTRSVGEIGKEKIKGAQLTMIPNAGHMVMFEKSNEVNSEIEEFLKGIQ